MRQASTPLIASAGALLIALTGGCTFSLNDSLFAAPGKFDSLDCPTIAEHIKATLARENRLNELVTRDSASAGGTEVNSLIYQDDLNVVRADLWGLRQASDAKHCPPVISTGQ
jgi:hypothetical protein